MRNYLVALGSILALGGTVFFALGTADETLLCLTDQPVLAGEITDSGPVPVPPGTLRVARLPGDTDPEELEGMCPGGVTVVKIPPGQLRDMLVCDVETEDDSGVWTTEVRYHPAGTALPPKCKLVCEDLPLGGYSMANVETGVEACLRVACAPCAISGNSWGACPHCLSDLTPSCAEACPVAEEIEP